MKWMFTATVFALAASAFAAEPSSFLSGYQAEAREIDPAFAASAQRGAQFFNAKHANEWSCASCHGNPPIGQGRHAKTGKAIAPLAPAANTERFADAVKVEKWFRRNCNDVLGRACTASEKADVLAFLLE